MIYKFKSKASGDVIMMGPNGDQLLSLLGHLPAPKGIIEVADLPKALTTLEAAADAASRPATDTDGSDRSEKPREVGLEQRLWPMIDMLQRAHAAGVPVVWGV